jgi:hypothetical protein
MQSKYYLFFLVFIGFISCNETTLPKVKSKMSNSFSEIEALFPNSIQNKDYIFFWREGSIEWSEYTSVLAIPLNPENKKSVYITINGNREYLELSKPIIIKSYWIELKPFEGLKTLFENHSSKPFENQKNKLNLHPSEGRCANNYIVKYFGENDVLFTNKNSSKYLIQAVKHYFEQVSAQEHFQLFSLENDCEKYDSLANVLLKTGELDSYSYQIDFSEIRHIPKNMK